MTTDYIADKLVEKFKKNKIESFKEYLLLKDLFKQNDVSQFKKVYSKYYGLNSAGLSDKWKAEYFVQLFSYKEINEENPFEDLLLHLEKIPRLKGDNALQFSFVIKLISFINESSPIYDKHVSNFFGISTTKISDKELRISTFTRNMNNLQKLYNQIAASKKILEIKKIFEEYDERCKSVHINRIIDFLVWNYGKCT